MGLIKYKKTLVDWNEQILPERIDMSGMPWRTVRPRIIKSKKIVFCSVILVDKTNNMQHTSCMNKIGLAIGMLGLAHLGFEHDNGWCYFGAFLCFFELT